MNRLRHVTFALLLVFVPSLVHADVDVPRAWLSWDSTDRMSNLPVAPQDPTGLYIQLQGISDPAHIEYQIQYAAPMGSNVFFRVLRADSLFLPGNFRPTQLDTTLLGGTVEGPVPKLTDPAGTSPSVLIEFPEAQEAPAMRFRLSRVIVRTESGRTIKPLISGSDVTIGGGLGVEMPPHLRVVQLVANDIMTTMPDAWLRVIADGLDPGWTLSLGTSEQSLFSPDTMEVHEGGA